MDNYDIRALIAFLILLIPFGLIWFRIFRHLKNRLTTTLSKWVMTLISLVCFFVYFYLMFWLGMAIDGIIGDSMASASFCTIVFLIFPLIIVFIVTLILTIGYYVKKADA
jgi:hypothetical protein